MNTDLTRKKTPEELELENKERELAGLEEITSERELELATIHAELQRFELKYLTDIGVLVTELDALSALFAEKSAQPHQTTQSLRLRRLRPESRQMSRTRLRRMLTQRKHRLNRLNHQLISRNSFEQRLVNTIPT